MAEGGMLMVTYSELFAFVVMIIAIVNITLKIIDKRK